MDKVVGLPGEGGVKRDGIIKGKRQRKLAREGEMIRGAGGGERQVR